MVNGLSQGGSDVSRGYCVFRCKHEDCSHLLKLSWCPKRALEQEAHMNTFGNSIEICVNIEHDGECTHDTSLPWYRDLSGNFKLQNRVIERIDYLIKSKRKRSNICDEILDTVPHLNTESDARRAIMAAYACRHKKLRKHVDKMGMSDYRTLSCRKKLYDMYNIGGETGFDKMMQDVNSEHRKCFMLSSESDANKSVCPLNYKYDALVFTSYKLVDKNVRSCFEKGELYLSLDGTFKPMGKSRKERSDEGRLNGS